MMRPLDSLEKGFGLYSIREVADYLHIKKQTLLSWFVRKESIPLLKSEVVGLKGEGRWLNFHDFVQAYTVRSLQEQGVKARAVRAALKRAKEVYGLDHPFSHKGFEVFSDDKGEVQIIPPNHEHPIGLTGKHLDQGSFKPVVKNYLKRLVYDDNNQVAQFVLMEKILHGKKRRVIMDPKINFGEPTVEGTDYRVVTLYDAARAEGSPRKAAEIYEVDEDQVKLAIAAYRRGIDLKAAA